MKRTQLWILLTVALGLAGIVGYEARLSARQRDQLTALRQTAAQLASEATRLRQSRDATARELEAAERQLAALPAVARTSPDLTPARRAEMTAWLGRVKELRRLFEANPSQQIPEMRFLTDQDWLRAAKNARLDSDDERRRALAAVRSAAVGNFMPQLSAALRKFVKASPGDAPTMGALAAFLDSPADTSLVDRYAVDKTGGAAPQWRVQQKLAIDPDYDGRHYVSAYADGRGYGSGTTGAPAAWIDNFRAQSDAAYKAYLQLNKGLVPKGLADVLPYFDPPLEPALAEKLLKAERAQAR
jgi:hypothetical protein